MRLPQKIKKFFGANRTIFAASAPGRLDVMGGIADYSGSHVLQMPIKERTTVYVSLRKDRKLRAFTTDPSLSEAHNLVEIPAPSISSSKKTHPYSKANEILNQEKENTWTAYLFGCLVALNIEYKAHLQGADFWVESNVPVGKGVSSSAALEVATLTALCSAAGIQLTENQLPVLAQKIENQIVGAPCGLMDQLATYFGRKRMLLPILCQPDTVYPPIDIPKRIHFLGLDSGQRHSVSGSSYTDVRTAAFMGYTIIARQQGVTKKELLEAKRTHSRQKLPYKGYLANISPSLFEQQYSPLLPNQITGSEFIKHYGSTIDPITTPEANREYAVKTCTTHPVYENDRVQLFSILLHLLNQSKTNLREAEAIVHHLGEWMYQSHLSYSRCGLGSEATDSLIKRARQAGPGNGIYGAKITGGGSGGTVCFLAFGQKGVKTVKEIAKQHTQEFECDLTLFTGSSEGNHWTKVEPFNT